MRLFILLLIVSFIPAALAEVSERPGFPVGFSVDISNAITVADINNDTLPEIVVAPNSRSVYVYSLTGNLLWKAIAGSQTPAVTVSPLVADVNGDGTAEVIMAGGTLPVDTFNYFNKLYVFSSDGNLARTYDLGVGYVPSTPAYADGLILVGLGGGLYAYNMTDLNWSVSFAGGADRMNSIAVGDLDGDGSTEAVLSGGGKVTVVNITASGGSVRWQNNLPGAISPVIINARGRKLVVAAGASGTFAWDGAGIQVWSSPVTAKYYYSSYSSPAVADLNGDGSEDVIIVNDYNVYAVSGVDGSMLPGFPVSSGTYPPGSFRAKPALYDINGDLKPEIILGDSNGNLNVWDSAGNQLEGFPVRITGRPEPLYSSPAAYDLDGYGVPSVIIGSSTQLHVVSVRGKNIPPKAVISDPNEGDRFKSYDTVRLASGSFDADGRVVSSKWYLNGSLLCEGSPCTVKPPAGRHNILLEVTDDRGAKGTAGINISINFPPVAVISGLKSVYNPWESVQLISQGFDTDGNVTSHEWHLDGLLISNDVNFSKTPATGTHVVNLTVKDNDGEYGSAEYTFRVNSPPSALISSPANGALLRQRDTALFSGQGNDKDGIIVSYRWNSSLDGELGRAASFSSSTLSVGEHRITLEVADNDGASGTGEIIINQTGYDVQWLLEKTTFNAGSTVPIKFLVNENGMFVEDRSVVVSIVNSSGSEVFRAGFADGSLRIDDGKYITNYHSGDDAYGTYTIKLGFDSKRPGQVFEKSIETSFDIIKALKHMVDVTAKGVGEIIS